MLVRVTDLKLSVEQPESELLRPLTKKLGVRKEDIGSWRILRKSLDARSRDDLKYVYTLAVDLSEENFNTKKLSKNGKGISTFEPKPFIDPQPGEISLENPPVIVGSGPAGLLAGYYLSLKGYKPIILERGKAVKERVPAVRAFDKGESLDQENNYLFGEGGAGCFSDGKLTCRITGPDVDWVLDSFVECGGRDSIRYEHRPHLGSNKLPMICRNFRRKIDAAGGEYRFDTCMESIDIEEGHVRGVHTSSGYIPTQCLILAMGHSARDTYEMLHKLGVPMNQKPFQLGLRIEQPQEQVNNRKYQKSSYLDLLGAADYTMVAKGEPDVYTFCMCAGGIVMPSISEPNQFCSNGMSNSRHDTPFANSGLMVTLNPSEFGSDHPLAGVELQRKYEAAAFEIGRKDYLAPIQLADDFLKQRSTTSTEISSSYQRGTVPCQLDSVLPESVIAAIRRALPEMDKRWQGDFLKNATLVGPEMRGSAPVRISRDKETRQTPGINGLYPIGEGAGYAGGIISAAVDGLRTAKCIVSEYAELSSAS